FGCHKNFIESNLNSFLEFKQTLTQKSVLRRGHLKEFLYICRLKIGTLPIFSMKINQNFNFN
ncbi:hypothetical protein, partial [Duncaniella muris]|uniref:hypothetical protein n=1 Tax=Duncaniella muris TaxID=2094150 RepID=UPI00272ABD2E